MDKDPFQCFRTDVTFQAAVQWGHALLRPCCNEVVVVCPVDMTGLVLDHRRHSFHSVFHRSKPCLNLQLNRTVCLFVFLCVWRRGASRRDLSAEPSVTWARLATGMSEEPHILLTTETMEKKSPLSTRWVRISAVSRTFAVFPLFNVFFTAVQTTSVDMSNASDVSSCPGVLPSVHCCLGRLDVLLDVEEALVPPCELFRGMVRHVHRSCLNSNENTLNHGKTAKANSQQKFWKLHHQNNRKQSQTKDARTFSSAKVSQTRQRFTSQGGSQTLRQIHASGVLEWNTFG